jgi:hypothetical protein
MNEKNQKIISLLERWMRESSNYDKKVWEYLKYELHIPFYGVPDKAIRDDKNYKKAE